MTMEITNNFGRIHDLLSPAQRRDALVLFVLMMVAVLLETLSIGVVIPVVSLLTQGDLYNSLIPSWAVDRLGGVTQRNLIVGAMIGLAVAYFAKNLFLVFLAWWQARFTLTIDVELSQRLFTTYLRQPWTFHLQRNSTGLFHNISNEAGLFTAAVTHAISLTTESLVLLGISILLLAVEPTGALIVVIVLGGVAWLFHQATYRQIGRWGELRQHHSALSFQHLMQGLGGAKDVKLLGRETDFLDRFKTHNVQSARVGQWLSVLQQMPRLGIELLMVGGLVTLVLTMVARDRDLATIVPTLGLFAAAAFRLAPSVNRILFALEMLRFEMPVLDALEEELALGAPTPNARTAAAIATLSEAIRLHDVSYAYPAAASRALTGVSMIVSRGESVGIIGSSGAGKTTLVDVILGLLTPDKGSVTVDGRDIQEDMRGWQSQIGYVPQSIYLTDDTICRNVAFGLSDDQIDDQAVQRAIDAAQLRDFVASLPEGVCTFVGERGIRLSGGQRQRIGIARALYHDPSILVLDEATSSLDTEAESDVMEAVNKLHGRKTLVVVAHRLSTVAQCDRLYRLEKGTVIAEGTPEKVLPKSARI
jgi:ATP-binding cassette, subfamily B, bacterial PglK